MGNSQTCFKPKDVHRTAVSEKSPPQLRRVKRRKSTAGLTDKERKKIDDFLGTSNSEVHRNSADTLHKPNRSLVPQIAINQEENRCHFVLVHGGGFGAWCWYKIIALLEESGFKVHALDMAASGVQLSDPNEITSLEQYAGPLVNFLRKLNARVKVILVGHDLGGVCVSYAMEMFPSKVEKAVFIAAAMLGNGQSVIDMFTRQASAESLIYPARAFTYQNGEGKPPTAIELHKALLEDMFFNRTPHKDIALASLCIRAIPFSPLTEKLSLSTTKYGSVRTFYIKTEDDYAIPLPLQEAMICSNDLEQVFRVKGSDHSPFFSKPQGLHRLLLEIANTQEGKFVPARRSCAL